VQGIKKALSLILATFWEGKRQQTNKNMPYQGILNNLNKNK
jgi:hypothetical protein